MLDVKKELVTALTTILPTYYEYLLGDNITLPCITYVEKTNENLVSGDTLSYSTIGFTIKLYSYSLDEIATYSKAIDTKLFSMGYERVSSNEIVIDKQIVKIFNYEALGFEER